MIDESKIPLKSIFKSSEVCEIVGVKPYILRFWETEFVEISPIVSSSGKKLFEKKDILLISIIKDLLFGKKLTLEKAKYEISKIDLEKLVCTNDSNNKPVKKNASSEARHSLRELIDGRSENVSNLDLESEDYRNDLGNSISEKDKVEVIQGLNLPEIPPVIPSIEDTQQYGNDEEKRVLDGLGSNSSESSPVDSLTMPLLDEGKLIELNAALDSLFNKTESLKSTYKW